MSLSFNPFFLLFSSKSNSWWHKKGREFVLMFVQSWGNKLDRDLANQNSLQKLSDPGGSRALDKQDWLFRRHAYITPIWAWAITCRQLRECKAESYWSYFIEKHGWISWFLYTSEAGNERHFLQNARALIHDRHNVKCLESCSNNMHDRKVRQGPKQKEQLSCSLFIINVTDNSWQQNMEILRTDSKYHSHHLLHPLTWPQVQRKEKKQL